MKINNKDIKQRDISINPIGFVVVSVLLIITIFLVISNSSHIRIHEDFNNFNQENILNVWKESLFIKDSGEVHKNIIIDFQNFSNKNSYNFSLEVWGEGYKEIKDFKYKFCGDNSPNSEDLTDETETTFNCDNYTTLIPKIEIFYKNFSINKYSFNLNNPSYKRNLQIRYTIIPVKKYNLLNLQKDFFAQLDIANGHIIVNINRIIIIPEDSILNIGEDYYKVEYKENYKKYFYEVNKESNQIRNYLDYSSRNKEILFIPIILAVLITLWVELLSPIIKKLLDKKK